MDIQRFFEDFLDEESHPFRTMFYRVLKGGGVQGEGVYLGCFSFECTAWWRVYIYCVWLYLGSREYRLLDQTLRE